MRDVLRYLHHVSAVLFYLLGILFFTAYVLMHNNMWPMYAALWLQVADIPFIAVALLYGGLSLYLSVRGNGNSKLLSWVIGVPLVLVFGALVAFNFWRG